MAGANKPNHGNSIMKAIREATGANDQDIQLVLKECGNDVNEAVARLIDCTYLLDWFFEQTRGGIGSRGPSPPLQRAYVATYVVTYLFGPSRGENGSGRPRSGSPRHLRGPSIRTQQKVAVRERPPDDDGPLRSLTRSIAPLAHSLILGRQFDRSIRVHPVQKGQDGAQEAEGREGEEGARLRAQAEWVWRRR